MAFLFKKGPADIVKGIAEGFTAEDEKGKAELEKRVGEMKAMVLGTGEKDPKPDKCAAVATAWQNNGLFPLFVDNFPNLEFETRKGLALVFNNLVQNDHGGFVSGYLSSERNIPLLEKLVIGYNRPDTALVCGSMVRECLRASVALHRAVLVGPPSGKEFTTLSLSVEHLVKSAVHDTNFEVAADAVSTMAALIECHGPLVREVIMANHETFFTAYKLMLQSSQYATRRQSLKMLSELLLDRDNFEIMLEFVKRVEHLKTIMLLMRDTRPNIQFEAFHVFKVFVANPQKPETIVAILKANAPKLIEYLRGFQNERDDAQFVEEKSLLIETLGRLSPAPAPAPAPAAAPSGDGGAAGSGGGSSS